MHTERGTGFSSWFGFTCFSKSHKSIPHQQFQLILIAITKTKPIFLCSPHMPATKTVLCPCLRRMHTYDVLVFERFVRNKYEVETVQSHRRAYKPPISRRERARASMNWWHCCPLFMIICGSGGDTHFPSVRLSCSLSMIYGVSDLNALMNVCIQPLEISGGSSVRSQQFSMQALSFHSSASSQLHSMTMNSFSFITIFTPCVFEKRNHSLHTTLRLEASIPAMIELITLGTIKQFTKRI